MRILFYIEFSSTVGLGHYNRSLLLARELNKLGFCIYVLDKYGLKSEFRQLKHYGDSKSIAKVIDKYSIDMLICDSYKLPYKFYCEMKKRVALVCFSDYERKHSADIFINQNLYANTLHYKSRFKLLARPYVRDEFKEQKIVKSTTMNRVGIILGGSDSSEMFFNLYERCKELEVTFFTTRLNKNIERLKTYNINLVIDSKNLAKEINNQDFMIISSSSVVYEVISLKKPFCFISVAPNQVYLSNYLSKSDLGYNLQNGTISDFLSKFEYYKKRVREFNINYCDYGKFFSVVLFKDIFLHKIEVSDAKKLYNLRNSKDVSEASIDSSSFSYSSHLEWLYLHIDKHFYKITNRLGIFCGYARLVEYEDGYLISIAIESSFRGKGLFMQVMTLLKGKYKKLYAQVKDGNIASLKAFSRANFIKDYKKDNVCVLVYEDR